MEYLRIYPLPEYNEVFCISDTFSETSFWNSARMWIISPEALSLVSLSYLRQIDRSRPAEIYAFFTDFSFSLCLYGENEIACWGDETPNSCHFSWNQMKVAASPAEEPRAAISTHNFPLVLYVIVWLSEGPLILSAAPTAGPCREAKPSSITPRLGWVMERRAVRRLAQMLQ